MHLDGIEPHLAEHRKQVMLQDARLAADIARQVAGGSRVIFGVMIESFLVAGRQEIAERASMTFGQSVTDGCLAWDTTVPVLEELADSVRQRRARG